MKTHEELNDRVGIAPGYINIGALLDNIGSEEVAIESFSKGLEVLEELEEHTGYHHPYIDTIHGYISKLQEGSDTASN